jgi:hypothetical protein
MDNQEFRDTIETAFGLGDIEIVAIADINTEIAKLVSYGVREMPLGEAPNYRLNWSNGSARWWSYPDAISDEQETIKLDANELAVSVVSKEVLDRVLPWLDPLPLYGASSEARDRGIYDDNVHFTGRVLNAINVLKNNPPWK